MRNKVFFGIFFLAVFLFASSANAAPVTGVVINLSNLGLEVGQTGTLVATVLPAGTADDPTVTWASSVPAVAFVNQNGQVVGLNEGWAVVTATTNTGGFVASCYVAVSVPTVPVTGVRLNYTALELTRGEGGPGEGDTNLLIATVFPEYTSASGLTASGKHVTWTSDNESVVTVTPYRDEVLDEGRDSRPRAALQAVAPGRARITVTTTDGGFTAFCDVIVQEAGVRVTGVELDKTALTLGRGELGNLLARVLPDGDPRATGRHVNWTSDNPAVATVLPVTDAEGGNPQSEIRAVSEGTARITATTLDGGFTAFCVVTVRDPLIPVSGVTLDATAFALFPGETRRLVHTVLPGNASSKHVEWSSSNNSIATVDITGEVRGVSQGVARVTVRTLDGGFTAFCDVQVNSPVVPVTGVTLDRTAFSLSVGQASTLVATVAPANATNKHVTWASANPAVATVGITGQVIAVSPGTTRITVTTDDGGFTAFCNVEVVSAVVPVTGVSLDKTALVLNVGQTSTLVATVAPANATGKHVTWSSSNNTVAAIDITGQVHALSPGTARITVTTVDGGFTDFCDVQVLPTFVPVTKVTLDQASITLFVGKKATLGATVWPLAATNKAVIWTTTNAAVAAIEEITASTPQNISSTAFIAGAAPGTARITVTTADGGFTAQCDVNVIRDTGGATEGGCNTGAATSGIIEILLFSPLLLLLKKHK